MAMSSRLLRPRASGSGLHPEAFDWISRVTTNGGTASTNTLAAVSTFCAAIDAAGLRGKFTRLNLFCGNSLAAALVPLYSATSFGGTVIGNATETNTGPFVTADYNETGSASGLKGNGSTKSLMTGVQSNAFATNNIHIGMGLRETDTRSGSYYQLVGVFNTVQAIAVTARRNDSNKCFVITDRFAGDAVDTASLAVGDIIATYPSFYRNGSQSGTSFASTPAAWSSALAFSVFGLNQNDTIVSRTDSRLNWYSIGMAMTSSQVAAFTNAIQAFNTTLSRT